MESSNKELESYSSFDNRIKKIKEYIDDIRVDLEDLKHNDISSNNNVLNKANDLKEEQYNSDAYSFHVDGNRINKDENLVHPNDRVFNSISTQELIQNMNASLNKNNYNDNNVTNSNLLLSNSSYNLNFNYNNNFEKKVKEEVVGPDVKIVNNPYSGNNVEDNSRRIQNDKYQIKSLKDYEVSLPRNIDHSAGITHYENLPIPNDQRNIYKDKNELNEDYQIVELNNLNRNKAENNSYYNEKLNKEYNNLYHNKNYSQDHLKPKLTEQKEELVYSDNKFNDNNYQNSKYPNEFKEISSNLNEGEFPIDRVLPNNKYQVKLNNSKNEYVPDLETNNKKVNTYNDLKRNHSHDIIHEPKLYSNHSLNYNYSDARLNPSQINEERNIDNRNYSQTPQLPQKQFNVGYNQTRQDPADKKVNFTPSERVHINDISDNITNAGYPTSNRSRVVNNENLKLNYNYNKCTENHNELIQNLEETEPIVDRPQYYPPNHNYKNQIPKHELNSFTILENKSSELEKQIAHLHIMINELQKNNTILQMEVVQLNQKNFYKTNNQNYYEKIPNYNAENDEITVRNTNYVHKEIQDYSEDTHIVNEIKNYFGGVKKEEIMNHLFEQSKQLVKARKMENFIEKIQGLYNSLYDIKDNSKLKVKLLWRWIKNVIRHVGNDKSFDINQQTYKEISQSLMSFYKLKDINELKGFLNKLTNGTVVQTKTREQPQRLDTVSPKKKEIRSEKNKK